MSRPYPLTVQLTDRGHLFSLPFPSTLLFPSFSLVKHSSFAVSNHVTIDVNPALRGLKQTVDKKQVCRVRQGALRGCNNDERGGRRKRGEREKSRERSCARSRCHFRSSFFFLSALWRLFHSSVRLHSRQLGIFRSTLDIVFAASRVSFSLKIPSARRRDGLPILPSLSFSIPSWSRCYETNTNTIENLTFACIFRLSEWIEDINNKVGTWYKNLFLIRKN